MTEIHRLKVKSLRNLTEVSLEPNVRVNVLFGENGSGKTSLLESIHMLSLGRSFRSRQSSPVVQLGSDETVIFGIIRTNGGVEHRVGIARSKEGESRVRLDGNETTVGDLATLTPVVVLSPESYELLVGGPRERRQYLDWGVFHVEPRYLAAWRRYQRALKQRNSLLRRGRIEPALVSAWNQQLAETALEMDELRQQYVVALAVQVQSVAASFSDALRDLKIHYQRGWPKDRSLLDVLQDSFDKDVASGRTLYGPHRADLRLTVGTLDAREHLSRGQQKLVVCAMKLAQGQCLRELSGIKSVYLVDDLHAELDERNAALFCSLLEKLDTQVFITSLHASSIRNYWNANVPLSMFHVEHGTVTDVSHDIGEL